MLNESTYNPVQLTILLATHPYCTAILLFKYEIAGQASISIACNHRKQNGDVVRFTTLKQFYEVSNFIL